MGHARNIYKTPETRRVIRTRDVHQTQTEIGVVGYSERLLSIVANFENAGVPEGYNAISSVGKSKRGVVSVRLFAVADYERGRFLRVGFRAHGCLAMLASASVAATLIEGKTFTEALRIGAEDIIRAVDGVPADKSFTVHVAAEAIRALVGDCLIRAEVGPDELSTLVPCD
ncbi:MAG: iron-sulfur cluster assembly scaffold protein, partial [Coriobacteriales bacterium]|nr:iron-sulfur cluster assembly scaffold protein [Coriobacteriales bacterium]